MPSLGGGLANTVTGTSDNKGSHADLAFSVRDRGLLDVRLRAPHRSNFAKGFLGVTSHWTAVPVGTADIINPAHSIETSGDSVEAPSGDAPDVGSNPVNARAIIVSKVGEGTSHLLRRIEVLGQKLAGKNRPQGYGGLVSSEGGDAGVTERLVELVKAQSGLDLGVASWFKLSEFRYRDSPSTVYFIPAHYGGEEKVVAGKQVVKSGEDGEKEEVKITPVSVFVSDLLQSFDEKDDVAAAEFARAADALDEFLKRENASQIVKSLQVRAVDLKESLKAAEEAKETKANLKRKREEEVQSAKRRRDEEMAELTSQWEEEDEGLTEDEITDLKEERKKATQELKQKHDDEEKKIEERHATEVKELEGSASGSNYTKEDPKTLEAYKYFDRQPGLEKCSGRIHKLRLENILMCLEEEMCLDEIDETLAPTSEFTDPRGLVTYKELSTTKEVKEDSKGD